jgi:hypothetical protein
MSNLGSFDIDALSLEEIVITNAAIDNKAQLSTLEKGKHTFKITYHFTPGTNFTQKKMRIIFSCEIKTFDNEGKSIDVSGRFDIAYFFSVSNLEEVAKYNKKELEIHSDLIATIANIAYSTSRGIIYTRCQGTIIKSLILPILSTQKLLDILQPQEGLATTDNSD